jgi:hypothetical protein
MTILDGEERTVPSQEVAAAAQDADLAAFDIDLDVSDIAFERLIIEPSNRDSDALDAGAIWVAEGALPESGFPRRAKIDDELLGAAVVG